MCLELRCTPLAPQPAGWTDGGAFCTSPGNCPSGQENVRGGDCQASARSRLIQPALNGRSCLCIIHHFTTLVNHACSSLTAAPCRACYTAGGRHLLRQLPQRLRWRWVRLLVPLRRRWVAVGRMMLSAAPAAAWVHACLPVLPRGTHLEVYTASSQCAPVAQQHAAYLLAGPDVGPLPSVLSFKSCATSCRIHRIRKTNKSVPRLCLPRPAVSPPTHPQGSPTSAPSAPAAPSRAARAAAASPPSPAKASSSASGRRAAATTVTRAFRTLGEARGGLAVPVVKISPPLTDLKVWLGKFAFPVSVGTRAPSQHDLPRKWPFGFAT